MIGIGSILKGLNFAYGAYNNYYRVQNTINTINEISKIGNISGDINPKSLLSMSETKGIVPDQVLNLAGTVGGRVAELATNLSQALDVSPIKSGIDNAKNSVNGLIDENKETFENGINDLKTISKDSGITDKVNEGFNKIESIKEQYKPMVESNIAKFKKNPALKELEDIK